ncbi:MAG TPA: hypothetical protein VM100_00350 [Longimicrobiales bacterium]|nr:hypothetical protein [Longimicrobiales bacterium]
MVLRAEIPVSPFDLKATTAQQLHGKFDPTGRSNSDALLKVHTNSEASTTVWRITQTDTGAVVEVENDRDGLFETVTKQFPLSDGAEDFQPEHPLLAKLASAKRGLRLMRVPWTFDIAAGAVLQQRVRWQDAYNDFRKIAVAWGTKTPAGVAFPSSTQLAKVPLFRLESIGLDPKRARALHVLARTDAKLRFLHPNADIKAVRARMMSLPGIGPWTTALVAGYALGDADAVPIGDLHLPSLVTGALAGEEDGTDERMLELLEPYRGQRFRVIRLLSWAARRAPHVLRQRITLACDRAISSE